MNESQTLNLRIQPDIAKAIKAQLRPDQSMETWLIEHLVSHFGLEERVRRRAKNASVEDRKEQPAREPSMTENQIELLRGQQGMLAQMCKASESVNTPRRATPAASIPVTVPSLSQLPGMVKRSDKAGSDRGCGGICECLSLGE